jgi:hypothetical protein
MGLVIEGSTDGTDFLQILLTAAEAAGGTDLSQDITASARTGT